MRTARSMRPARGADLAGCPRRSRRLANAPEATKIGQGLSTNAMPSSRWPPVSMNAPAIPADIMSAKVPRIHTAANGVTGFFSGFWNSGARPVGSGFMSSM